MAILLGLALAAGAPASNDVAACTARSLYATAALQGATGSMAGGIRVRNRGKETCRLGGRPAVILRASTGATFVARQVRGRVTSPFEAVQVLKRGESAFAFVLWRNWCGRWPSSGSQPLVLDVTLTSGARLRVPFRTWRPRCDSPDSPPMLIVSPFASER
jgi:Protein of unknown function (DUF4232)